MDDLKKLAILFSLTLQKEIGIENLHKVIKINSITKDKNNCYSTNFCDTNQLILDVLNDNTKEFDHLNWKEFTTKAIEVWNIANENNFFI
jgi:hypothetical protein